MAKSRVIPILCTSANHLTPAHVLILSSAETHLREQGFQVDRSIISPVNDFYINSVKKYNKVDIDGQSVDRTLFSGKERIRMAKATIRDAEAENMEVSSFEINNRIIPGGKDRGYIEHWEMLTHLQKEEIERCKKTNEAPTLFVLVAGADLANSMRNWSFMSGMPFLIATRKDTNIPLTTNFETPASYLKSLGYGGDAFSNFRSGIFQTPEDPLASLSSTKLSSCNPEVLQLMGNQAFAELLSILIERSTSSTLPKAQIIAAATAVKAIKRYNQQQIFDSEKQTIIQETLGTEEKPVLKSTTIDKPTTAKQPVQVKPSSVLGTLYYDKKNHTTLVLDQAAVRRLKAKLPALREYYLSLLTKYTQFNYDANDTDKVQVKYDLVDKFLEDLDNYTDVTVLGTQFKQFSKEIAKFRTFDDDSLFSKFVQWCRECIGSQSYGAEIVEQLTKGHIQVMQAQNIENDESHFSDSNFDLK